MFRNGPWLGQVPLVARGRTAPPTVGPLPSLGAFGQARFLSRGPAIGCPLWDDVGIPATGGRIMRPEESIHKRNELIHFYMDREVRDAIESRTGERPPRPFETQVAFCNPTPGTIPALGDFTDPETGEACFLELPEGWGMAYLDFLLETNLNRAHESNER